MTSFLSHNDVIVEKGKLKTQDDLCDIIRFPPTTHSHTIELFQFIMVKRTSS